MAGQWEVEVIDRPGINLSVVERDALQSELRELGSICLNPLPNYQVFERESGNALDDKIVVVARAEEGLVAFVSTIVLTIEGLEKPVIHTGLTVIHPSYRKSGVMQDMFANLFFYLLASNPEGVWCTTLAEVISSLAQMALYTTKAFPSPQWLERHPSGKPSPTHLRIARAVSREHRNKLMISPQAAFDETTFVFRSSNDSAGGKAFWKDVDDPIFWHRDRELSAFFRKLFRRHKGDEVLQVSYLTLEHLDQFLRSPRYKGRYDHPIAKL
ncbi:hypothetical protein BX600DRAFT_438734 [Xylariales sp. PMI_506]|nr:hypothetical protein BX600DRAFT_438734 [Xylariales sp. PMI_506]